MKEFKSHFKFTKQQRSGIFALSLFVIFFQTFIYYNKFRNKEMLFNDDDVCILQNKIDSLKRIAILSKQKIYPFNPNFITDYKGYTLGMTLEEIDRLHNFRKQNRYINSAKEFQQVTQVSDSLLETIQPFFKFPDWVTKKKFKSKRSTSIVKIDINTATIKDLQKVNGIGEKLSNRIIRFRKALNGFQSLEQLKDVYGLDDKVRNEVLRYFKLEEVRKIDRININHADERALSRLIYIDYQLALNIVEYRTLNGYFVKLDDLKNVDSFPVDKIDRIKLYLSLE